MTRVTATSVAKGICVVAFVEMAASGALGSGFSPIAIPFILWWMAPYAALWAVARVLPMPWLVGGAGAAALTVETGIRASVFLFPRGSTDAIALVFSPVLVGFTMGVGALAGLVIGYVFERSGTVVRLLTVAAAAAIAALTVIGLARPELFPTRVMARQRQLQEIGDPRVVAGADRFRRDVVQEAPAWFQAGDFDGQPGEDLAIVDHKGAQVIDVATLKPARFIAFGGEPGRLWNWYSKLTRFGSSFVVVQTGGGFQDTQVMSLDNTLLWQFRPDAKLPPTALLPGDADADGETELYASTTDAIVRLNTRGEEVWKKPSTLPHLVAVVAKDAREPAWIVSARHGSSVDVWSADGARLAEIKWPGPPVRGVVEWPAARRVIVGDESVAGIDLEGRRQFEIAIDEPMRLLEAVAWSPFAGKPGLLVVTAAGDRDLDRSRLRVYATPEAVIYDEVFTTPPRLLVAKGADGASTLFVIVGSQVTILRATTS
jgi:hypothetical protein